MQFRNSIIVGAIAFCSLGVGWVGPRLAVYFVPRGHARPMTIVETVRYENSKFEEVWREERLLALRSDGSESITTRFVAPRPAGTPEVRRDIVDVTAKRTSLVDNFTQSDVSVNLSASTLRHYRQKWSAQCKVFDAQLAQSSSAEKAVQLGFSVVKVVRRDGNVAPGVSIEEESWIAPDLYCYALRSAHLKVQRDGQPLARTISEVTSVKFGEPDPALFRVPNGYVKRTPPEIIAEYEKRFGKPGNCSLVGPAGQLAPTKESTRQGESGGVNRGR